MTSIAPVSRARHSWAGAASLPRVGHERRIARWRGITTTPRRPTIRTCKMGADPMAVVDHELRVHGIQGLRQVTTLGKRQRTRALAMARVLNKATRGSMMEIEASPGLHSVRPHRRRLACHSMTAGWRDRPAWAWGATREPEADRRASSTSLARVHPKTHGWPRRVPSRYAAPIGRQFISLIGALPYRLSGVPVLFSPARSF